MPRGYAPTVFVSSTCYDLGQVRADLKRFIESMGLEPVLSESPAFPVDPQITPVANCTKAVRDKADIFVLVVGARYGTQDQTGRSITNLEYLEAKAKGIPIYVFVSQQIIHNLPVWKANRDGNFTTIVDTPKLFEFVDGLRGTAQHWVFGFNEAGQITEHLRNQWAYLFMDGLAVRQTLQEGHIPISLRSLSPPALKILFERPDGWHFYLLSRVVRDEFALLADLRRDMKYGVLLGPVQPLKENELFGWLIGQLLRLGRIIESVKRLVNDGLKDAKGPPGVASDPELIVYVARRIASIYRELLEWTQEFTGVDIDKDYQRVVELVGFMAKDAIAKVESFPDQLDSELRRGEEAIKRGEKNYVGTISVEIEVNMSPELQEELDRVKDKFGIS